MKNRKFIEIIGLLSVVGSLIFVGLEINQNRIKNANIGINNTKFQAADITKIDIPQADCIIFTHVLHHLTTYEAQEKLLRSCYDKLKFGGRLIISEVDKFPRWKYLISLFADKILYPFEKINYRSVENLSTLLKKNVLSSKHCIFYHPMLLVLHMNTLFSIFSY